MATDTARVRLELASGRNEVTAPFRNTVERQRSRTEEVAIAADTQQEPAAASPVVIAVPLANADSLIEAPIGESPPDSDRPAIARPPWIAFIAAMLVVAAAVWWVMSLRMPDLDPWQIVQRNLDDARQAMADGRYTDPSERSALHYYSTVLALDPANADAIAGIDSIADRHLTEARVLLADHRIAEAAVALDKARRVRPDHNGLAALDTQLRGELRKILATAAAPPPVETSPAATPKATNGNPASARVATNRRNSESVRPQEVERSPAIATPLPEVTTPAATLASIALVPTVVAPTSSAITEKRLSNDSPAGAGPSVDNSSTAADSPAVLPEPAPTAIVQSAEPKLIKMVQPTYPPEALMRGVEGWVEVSLQVTAAGNVVAPRVEETSRGRMFNRAALAAVEQWKYEPRGDGAPTQTLRVRLQFRQSN